MIFNLARENTSWLHSALGLFIFSWMLKVHKSNPSFQSWLANCQYKLCHSAIKKKTQSLIPTHLQSSLNQTDQDPLKMSVSTSTSQTGFESRDSFYPSFKTGHFRHNTTQFTWILFLVKHNGVCGRKCSPLFILDHPEPFSTLPRTAEI